MNRSWLLATVGLLALAAYTKAQTDCPIDLVFVVDRSGSICDNDGTFDQPGFPNTCNNWNQVISFMTQMVETVNVGANDARVALITFGSRAETQWNLAAYTDKAQVLNAIRNLQYEPFQRTFTADAINLMMAEVFTGDEVIGDRAGVTNVALIITDGIPSEVQQQKQDTIPNAQSARGRGVVMFSIGITELIDIDILKGMSSVPQVLDQNYFTSPDFDLLGDIVATVQQQTCAARPTPAPPADGCSVIDIVFVVDASGSICDNDLTFDVAQKTCNNWDLVRQFILNFVDTLSIGPNDAQVGMVVFASGADVRWTLDTYDNKADLRAAVQNLQYEPFQRTFTADGLRLMRTEVFNIAGDRAIARNVAIVITDGIPTSGEQADNTVPEADLAEDERIVLKAVGVTTLINEEILQGIASGAAIKDQDYFTSPDFSGLDDIIEGLIVSACAPEPSPCATETDIVFILDESGSIGDSNFNLAKDFVKSLVRELDVEGERTRFGLIAFANNPRLIFRLDQFENNTAIDAAIDNIRYQRGTTNTAGALEYVYDNMFNNGNGDRTDVPNLAVVLTDGGSNRKQDTVEMAIRAKKRMTIISIGVGGWTDEFELMAIASDPYQQSYFPVRRYSELENIAVEIGALLCNNINECVSGPCQNGGSCVDGINQYYCMCPPSYGGVNCEYMCRRPKDVAFALDASGSIGRENFHKTVEWARNVVREMPVTGNGGTRVSLETYGTNSEMYFYLNEHDNKIDILNAMSILYFSGGTTNTAGALQSMRNDMFTSGRGDQNSLPNVGIVVTDGRSNDFTLTTTEAREARKKMEMISVGVGRGARMSELRAIASYPTNRNVMMVDTFDELSNIKDNVRDAVCQSADPCESNPCRNGGQCSEVMNGYFCECAREFTGVNCERSCTGIADVVFVLDRSGSVRHERFEDIKEFIIGVINELEVWGDKVRVGFVAFDVTPELVFRFDTFDASQDMAEAVRAIQWQGGRTDISSALKLTREDVLRTDQGDRTDAPNFLFLWSDGGANLQPEETIPEAVQIKVSGTHITAINVGRDTNMDMLRGIVSYPSEANILTVQSFTQLQNLLSPTYMSICNQVNECTNNPCLNGGTCVDQLNGYVCVCPSDRTGINCNRRCNRRYDIAFVVDLSGSVDVAYNYSVAFLREMIYGLEYRFDTVRTALVSFDTDSRIHAYLNTYQTQQDMLITLAFQIQQGNRRTNTHLALRDVRDRVFTSSQGDRNGEDNYVILLTDGAATDTMAARDAARDLRDRGTNIHVVAIGSQVAQVEMDQLASGSGEPFIVRVENQGQVVSAADTLLNALCN